MRLRVLGATVGWLGFVSMAAQAQPPPPKQPQIFYPPPRVQVVADLLYVRVPEASICPGEARFRSALADRMGVDSFTPDANAVPIGRVRVVVSRTPDGFKGTYEWTDAQGVPQRPGSFTAPGTTRRDCLDVLEDLATSLSVQWTILEINLAAKYAHAPDPAAPAPPPPTPAPPVCAPETESPPEPLPPPLEVPPPTKPPTQPPPLAFRFGVALWPEWIASDEGWFGISVDAGVRYRAFSVGLAAHGDPPLGARSFYVDGSVSSARLMGTLALCGHFDKFIACLKGDAGTILFPHPAPQIPSSTLYGAMGGQVGVEYPVAPPWFFLRTTLDLSIPIRPAEVRNPMGGNPLFTIASPNLGLGLGVLWEFGPH